ncbi:G protein-coupled receptor, rhodopsin-like family and GPCR, rhodopsin-like, 7TM domain-containing protein [Strongyloides ratti]|uniref:G protein-coupled receptor, rhodopsin-like family and GPCR, rhodopsin-like, 7TM domain-containing protein n=1 Tax=Strongyloides ratti TaxID=34506 RepID=A0A090LNQ6_STRRB|nr:G protein-coupled receptor, rhodopsin-like family and GPCR, rhodopsin-like, 7TM domain-containing protein [Strongyloides ratti]CEF69155.1 G protein-coupled receptor, rhodopsin-like family and GPCR, rhodopsin-like, 7TM domain-containing protein [Strongyloides ratti]
MDGNDTTSHQELQCMPTENYDFLRFAVVLYIGTPISLLGVIFNFILIRIFLISQKLFSSSLYLLVLAILDLFICLMYIPFFTVDALAIYLKLSFLHDIYQKYVMFLYGFSKQTQFASTYVILFGTLERFIMIANIKSLSYLITTKGRLKVIISIILTSFLLRLPSYFEYSIEYLENCLPFENYDYNPILADYDFYPTFSFYVFNIFHVMVPFILLMSLNIMIVTLTKKKVTKLPWSNKNFTQLPKLAALLRKECVSQSDKKQLDEIRYQTRTIIFIVSTYLTCNLPSVFITVLEKLFPKSPLIINEDATSSRFYTLCSDAISILVCVNSFLRIFIYYAGNPTLRNQLKNLIFFKNKEVAAYRAEPTEL